MHSLGRGRDGFHRPDMTKGIGKYLNLGEGDTGSEAGNGVEGPVMRTINSAEGRGRGRGSHFFMGGKVLFIPISLVKVFSKGVRAGI
jgi:hypothetical protein